MSEIIVTIPMTRYKELYEAERFLNKLIGAGVDNWDGYEECLDDSEDEESEEDIYGDEKE